MAKTVTVLPTYTATIYVGRLIRATGEMVDFFEIRHFVQAYVNRVRLCVTFTPTTFYYVDGNEPGYAIGLINYPRFPSSQETLRNTALNLAEELLTFCKQERISVVFPDETVMIADEDRINGSHSS